MGAWASLAAATSDLRTFCNDGPQDHLSKSKIIVGPIDGVNTTFFTYEDRIVTTLLPVTVSQDYVDLPASNVTVLDNILGMIQVSPAPPPGVTLRARYYYQFFLDAELQEALALAAGEIVESDDITLVAFGLKNAALNYGASFAWSKQASRWSGRMATDRFLIEDSSAENPSLPDRFAKLAETYYTRAVQLRDSFYTRHGRRNAPAFAVFKPTITPIAPRR